LQSTAKSIADIVEYGPLFDFFDDANIKLSFADSNVVSFAGIRLLYDEILRSTNVDTPVLTLDFSRNQIQMLPEDALSGLEYITSLNLRSNAIKKIKSDAFSGASQLQYVDLSDNQIETIESDAFVDLSNIRELDLSNNQIKTIPEEAFGDIGLGLAWKLNISGNNLDEDNKARLQNALPNVIITF
jgi:Leucine-rich repeat (LRR) protein